ncbi:hypothetical protein JD508_15695 [Aeromonas jandaei]|uniref:hypothetical protein n=1 Tax=Aeromonas jandaei TaxID=650 RepID=UPI00191FDD3A|nr:hypothetical protein [Aeromonas jandaei]MBL0611681.1 hypothetical protein [Aeromonas jandaei]
MMKLKSILLVVSCVGALYGCGGGSDESKVTVVKQSNPDTPQQLVNIDGKITPHDVKNIDPKSAIFYNSELINSDSTLGLAGLALNYNFGLGQKYNWQVMVDDGHIFSAWFTGFNQVTKVPGELLLNRVSRSHSAPSVEQSRQKISIAADKLRIVDEVKKATANGLDLSLVGMVSYTNWSGKIKLTPIETSLVNTASWHPNNGLATDMLGNVETTRNGDMVTITMELPAAGCTLVGRNNVPRSRRDMFTFSGFDKCQFDPAKGANWAPNDYYNNDALAKARDGVDAYMATFKNDGGAEMLVIGFPNLEGLFFVVPKS